MLEGKRLSFFREQSASIFLTFLLERTVQQTDAQHGELSRKPIELLGLQPTNLLRTH